MSDPSFHNNEVSTKTGHFKRVPADALAPRARVPSGLQPSARLNASVRPHDHSLCRPAVQSDAQAIDAAAYASAVQHYSDNPHLFAPPKAAPGAWSTDLLQEHHDARVFVAEHLGEVVGFVHVTINLETRALFNQAKYGKIESVAVLLRQRGKGFGTALLQHAEAWAREHGCPEVGSTCGSSMNGQPISITASGSRPCRCSWREHLE